MKIKTSLLPILFLIALVSGCSSESQPAEPKAKILSDGAEHVIIGGEPIWPADAVRFEVEQVFGTDEDHPESMLSRPGNIHLDDGGNLYLFDSQDHNLVKFNADGSLAWRVGQQGQGPEDFQYAYTTGLDNDGTSYVVNQNWSRMDIWSTDGKLVNSIPMDDKFPGRWIMDTPNPNEFIFTSTKMGSSDRTIWPVTLSDSGIAIGDSLLIVGKRKTPKFMGLAGLTAPFGEALIADMYADSLIADVYDESGKRVKRFQLGEMSFGTMGFEETEDGGFSIKSYGSKGVPRQIAENIFLWQVNFTPGVKDAMEAFKNEVDNENKTYQVYLFDKQGNILWKDESDDPDSFFTKRIVHISDNGAIYYYTDDPYPQIQRGRLIMPD